MGQYRETGGEWEVTLTNTYNKYNQLKSVRETIGDRSRTKAATYDGDGRVATYREYNSKVTYDYETRGRLKVMTTNHTKSDKDILTETYIYRNPADKKTSAQVYQFHSKSCGSYDVTYTYTYDANGNILSVNDGTHKTTYVYDSAGQLLRENNQAAGTTTKWTYDDAGNITSRKEYAYTTGTVGTATDSVTYGYTHETWGDLLKSYDGTTLYYDNAGNLTSGPGWRYTWEHGRQLATMEAKDGSTTWSFTYNADGLRTGRTNGTTNYKYQYLGGQLVKMTVGDTEMYFNYDASGTPLSIVYNGTSYYYVTNLQGDVVGIVNQSGNQIVGYTYDAWGNVMTTTGSGANTIGKNNPLRYRGYVYDTETRLYYLQSRYYNPEWGRFINADAFTSTGGLLGNNMFAYCNNNPVNNVDTSGCSPILVAAVLGLGTAIGAFTGWLAAASTGNDPALGAAQGAASGFVGSLYGLFGSCAAAAFVGASVAGMFIDCVTQLYEQAYAEHPVEVEDMSVDYGRMIESGATTGLSAAVPGHGSNTGTYVDAVGTIAKWFDGSTLITVGYILYEQILE